MAERGRRAGAPTLTDVARAAGVSLATASRVFSGSPTVDAGMAARVIEAGRRLGYRPDPVAQMTANRRSTLVGVIADRPREARFSAVFRGIVDAAEAQGLTVLLSGAVTDEATFAAAARIVLGYRPHTVVLVPRGDALLRAAASSTLLKSGPPIAVVGGGGHGIGEMRHVPLGDPDASRDLAAELGLRGYRRVLVVGSSARFPVEHARTAELVDGVGRWATSLRVETAEAPTRDAGYRLTSAALGADRFDLVVCVADELAVGAMTAVRDLGLRPGLDVGISGYDDLAMSRDVFPALTTVRSGLASAGARALEVASSGEATPIPAEVLFRQSTRGPA